MCVWLPLCVSVCARASLFKGTTARRKLNLPTWQLAPLITKSNTHQRMSNEALLRELWLTVGLGPTPQVWITYYVLLKPSLKYIDKWMVMSQTWQRFDLRQTASRRQSKSAVWTAHDHWTFLFNHGVRKTPSELSIQSKLVLNKGAEGKSFLKSIVLHSPCLTLEAHAQLVTQSNLALIFSRVLHYISSASKTSMVQYNDRPPKSQRYEKDLISIMWRCAPAAGESTVWEC